jgi:hypothetical protein
LFVKQGSIAAHDYGGFYLVLKSLVLPRMAGSSMGQACPALRGILYSGFAVKMENAFLTKAPFKI